MSFQRSISATNLFQSDTGEVLLQYQKDWSKVFSSDPEYYHDFGFVIRATAHTGEDIHLWLFMYRQKCSDAIVQGDLCQTALLITDFSPEEKKSMHVTPFIELGQNIEDYLELGSLTVKEDQKSYEWQIGGRKVIAEPPEWHIQGSHAGVTTDIRIHGLGPGFFNLGRFESWAENGTAGYTAHARAEGLITFHDRTLNFKGFAMHENIGQRGTTLNLPNRINYMGTQGHYCAHGFGDDFSWFMLVNTTGPWSTGYVRLGDKLVVAKGRSDLWLEVAEEWLDPESRQLVPRKWRGYLRSPVGTLELSIHAYGRIYYTWNRLGGVIVVYQMVCHAQADFTCTDGQVLHHDQQPAYVQYSRTLHDRKNQWRPRQ